jgi:hypothetical protein
MLYPRQATTQGAKCSKNFAYVLPNVVNILFVFYSMIKIYEFSPQISIVAFRF